MAEADDGLGRAIPAFKLGDQPMRDWLARKLRRVVLLSAFVLIMAEHDGGRRRLLAQPGDTSLKEAPNQQRDDDGDPLPSGAIRRLGSRRYAIGGPAFQCFLAPDGKALLTRSIVGDATPRLWDIATGKPIRNFQKPGFGQLGIALSPDGNLVAIAVTTNTSPKGPHDEVCFCHAATGHLAHRLPASGQLLVVSNDGKKLAAAHFGGQITVWDIAAGTKLADFQGEPAGMNLISFTPDGRQLISAAPNEGWIEIWDITSQRRLWRLHEPTTIYAGCISVSPDGKRLARSDASGNIPIFDLTTGKLLRKFPSFKFVATVLYSPDGRLLASGESSGQIEPRPRIALRDANTGEVRRSLDPGPVAPRCLSFSRDGKTLAAVGDDGEIRVWEAASGKRLHPSGDPPGALVELSASGDQAWTQAFGMLSAWDVATGRRLGSLPANCVAFSADRHRLATFTNNDQQVSVWDAASRHLLFRIHLRPANSEAKTVYIDQLALSPDGRQVAACCRRVVNKLPQPSARIWNTATGQEIHRDDWQHYQPEAMAFSPDGALIAMLKSTIIGHRLRKSIRFFSTTDAGVARVGKSEILLPDLGLATPSDIRFSPDSRMVAVNGQTRLEIWEIASGTARMRLDDRSARILAVQFSPRGDIVASADEEGIRIWNLETGALVKRFSGHSGVVKALSFSADGKVLASGSSNSTILIWDVDRLQRTGK